MRTRTKVLYLMIGLAGAFVVYTLIIYTINGWQWDNLFPYVLTGGGIIGGLGSGITIAEKVGEFFGNKDPKSTKSKGKK